MPRPRKPKAEKRASMVWVRMTEEEKRVVDEAAQRDGLPASTWMRVVVLKAAAHGGLIGKPGSGEEGAAWWNKGAPLVSEAIRVQSRANPKVVAKTPTKAENFLVTYANGAGAGALDFGTLDAALNAIAKIDENLNARLWRKVPVEVVRTARVVQQ